jgi:acetylornithine deacetylase/succinyl-diaminopimelate desuccinylase-like protein
LVLGEDGKMKFVGLQSAEKGYQDFVVSTKGTTGHSSVPLPDNAIYRLSRALDRLAQSPMPARLLPVTRAYFVQRARLEPPPLAAAMRALSQAKGSLPKGPLKVLERDPVLSANVRTTCVATMIEGGTKANALPPEAHANVNCRILPDETVAAVKKQLTTIFADPRIELKTVPPEDTDSPGASPTQGEVPAAIEKIAGQLWPSVPVIPMMSRGATDSRYLREKGVAAYGINPIAETESDGRRAHGVDERIPIASLDPAVDFLHRLVWELAVRR